MENRIIKFRAWDGKNFHYFNVLMGLYGIVPLSVQQFTGLLDKDGKEIYEGDILTSENHLKMGNPNYAPVVFESGAFTFHGCPLGYDEEEMMKVVLTDWAIVSGNIYEHPDLLK